jgi:hypothetical protein
MSYVIDQVKLFGFVGGQLSSYEYLFWSLIKDPQFVLRGGIPFETYGDAVAYYEELHGIFFEWLSDDLNPTKMFDKRYRHVRFPKGEIPQLKEDWPPPATYTERYASALALPQSPQRRKVIYCDGVKRTIRIK